MKALLVILFIIGVYAFARLLFVHVRNSRVDSALKDRFEDVEP